MVSRLCSPIEGTDPGRLAGCLGLDASRFHSAGSGGRGSGAELREELGAAGGGSLLDDDDTYKGCDPLWLCSAEGVRFKAVPAAELAGGGSAHPLAPTPLAEPLTPAQLANQAVLAARGAIDAYYAAPLRSDDEVAPVESRDVSLRVIGASTPGSLPACASGASTATMLRGVTEAQLYTQLSHFTRLVDTRRAAKRAVAATEAAERDAAAARAEAGLRPVAGAYGAALAMLRRFSDRCLYKWIDMGRLYSAAPATARA